MKILDMKLPDKYRVKTYGAATIVSWEIQYKGWIFWAKVGEGAVGVWPDTDTVESLSLKVQQDVEKWFKSRPLGRHF